MSLTLQSRYRILGPVASGGMGSVQLALARDESGAAHPVALKTLHAHLADDAQMVAMFVDEARIASRLSHPNIVRVNDVEMLKGDVVLVMDFIEGIPLSVLLKKLRERNAPLSIPLATRIVHDALLGLHAAHELRDDRGAPLGVIHRDVSPHNVLLGVDGLARIADFGVAKARGRLATTEADGAVKGKLQYLAPEQIYRKPTDRRVDVFSAGIVLWECLTGRGLFHGESEGETLARVINEPIDPPSFHRMEIPLDLDEICLRALERDPRRRWPTAEEFARALESTPLAGQSEVARVVAEIGAETIAEHRAMLERAKAEVPEPPASSPGLVMEAPRARSRWSLVAVAAAVGVGAIGGGLFTSSYKARATTPAIAATMPNATNSVPAPVASEIASAAPSTSTIPAPSTSTSAPAASSVSAKPARPGTRPAGRARPSRGDAGTVRPFEPDDL